jgi:signal peptidase
MKKVLAFLGETIFVIVVIVLCVLILAVAQGYHPSLFGYQVLRVVTASMSPTLQENTLILIHREPEEEIAVGDIITFISDDPTLNGFYNTHRVASIYQNEESGETYYITQGDMNDVPDLYPVAYSQVAGKFLLVLPLGNTIGRWISALTDSKHYFLIVMLPLFLCLFVYMWQIFRMIVLEDDEETDANEQDGEGRQVNKEENSQVSGAMEAECDQNQESIRSEERSDI